MRKVTFGGANSLDGFVARPNHGMDWLLWSDDVAAIGAKYWKTVDAVVMGRKTYEVAARSGTTVYPGVKNYVLSRTMRAAPDPAVELVSRDAAEFVGELKRQPGKGICIMGGGELANALLRANLVDEIGLNVHPVLLGSGIPLFHGMDRDVGLELVECKRLPHGCVLLRYRVKH